MGQSSPKSVVGAGEKFIPSPGCYAYDCQWNDFQFHQAFSSILDSKSFLHENVFTTQPFKIKVGPALWNLS